MPIKITSYESQMIPSLAEVWHGFKAKSENILNKLFQDVFGENLNNQKLMKEVKPAPFLIAYHLYGYKFIGLVVQAF